MIFACGNVWVYVLYTFSTVALSGSSRKYKRYGLQARISRSMEDNSTNPTFMNLVRHVLTIMASVQKNFPSSPLPPIFAVPLPPFHLRKCVPQESTIQQLPYQSLQSVHTCIDEHQSWEEEITRESTHPNMAPIPFGCHPNTCGYGPNGNPDRSLTSACPAALPEIGWPSA